ncbi:deoxyguanosinetriphosphate triphosphohydrolase family protein [Streptomyces sp. Marseille-Q5077]|uniref:deoxyguanosinetriphosphate triphosphohydrolase family protein n=1 Tax=Streptomyces sp. Marseille-Q5077 TaxID=3418995 RepID=UPI003D073D4C
MSNFHDNPPYGSEDRAYQKGSPASAWGRSAYELDRDRVLYSSSFRRLAGVTQTSAVNERRLLHNRLTHSLKVAQIGRRICQYLYRQNETRATRAGLEPDVVEAAGLAHDLGHPPFGHIAEQEIDDLTEEVGGFEGNAQTLRIVTKLAVRRQPPQNRGLDLTRETLNAILKYPRPREAMVKEPPEDRPSWTDRSRGHKWGAYETEAEDLEFARRHTVGGEVRSPNAMVMDWADDVGFATHDLDDYFRAGMIPLDRPEQDKSAILAHAGQRLERIGYTGVEPPELARAYDDVFREKPPNPFSGSRRDRYAIHHFVSDLIGRCVQAVSVLDVPPWIDIEPDIQYQVEILKELTWFYVIESPSLAALQQGQRRMIRELYGVLLGWLEDAAAKPRRSSVRIPASLESIVKDLNEDRSAGARSLTPEQKRMRAVSDYICTLTEDQAYDLFERITGMYRGSMFGAWF